MVHMHRKLGGPHTWYGLKVKRKIPVPTRNQNLLFQAIMITLADHINFVNLFIWFF
jgi:hypothetical protein